MDDEESDAIVIGGGLAGIAASLELLEAGRRVLLLDRDGPEVFGGLARESFGGIFVVGSAEQKRLGIRDDPSRALADWLSFGELSEAETWPRAWAKAYVENCHDQVYRWLKGFGIGFLPMPLWIERGGETAGNSVPRFHIVWGTGRELALRLIGALRAHRHADRLEIRFGQRVEGLIARAGRVVGCRGVAEADGRPFEAYAGQILVAAGGVNGDLGRVRANWPADWTRPPEVILNGSHRFADGLLHDAVERQGGVVRNLDRMWNYASGVHHWAPRKPLHGLSLVPSKSAIWLNWRGERIGPKPLVSGFDTRALVGAVCRQERGYSWQVMNKKIALKELAVSGAEFNPAIREKSWPAFLRDILFGNRWLYRQMTGHCADLVTADSVEELAAAMNRLQGDGSVRPEALYQAIGSYQDDPDDEQLRLIARLRQYRGDRMRIARSQRLTDPSAMPLIAIREFIVSRKSLGGIVTDLAGRVLDERGEVVPGLFAAGEATGFGGGGMHGNRALEGTFLGGCILTGRFAGMAMAGQAIR